MSENPEQLQVETDPRGRPWRAGGIVECSMRHAAGVTAIGIEVFEDDDFVPRHVWKVVPPMIRVVLTQSGLGSARAAAGKIQDRVRGHAVLSLYRTRVAQGQRPVLRSRRQRSPNVEDHAPR